MKAKKKPVVIDFYQFTDKSFGEEIYNLRQWVTLLGDDFDDYFIEALGDIRVKTLEGTSYIIRPSEDVIIKGIAQDYYPCKLNIFLQTYDVIDDNN